MGVLTTVMLWMCRVGAGFFVLATLLPLLRLGYWMVRVFDFPRVQLLVLGTFSLCLLVLPLTRRGWKPEFLVIAGLVLIAGAWQIWCILPFTHLWRHEVESAEGGVGSLLICNLDKENERHEDVLKMMREQDPDVLLLIEMHEQWAEALSPLHDSFPHRVQEVLPDGLGLGLWSRFEIVESEIRYLVSEKRPSIHATLRTPDGNAVRFVGIHPTPPGLPVEDGSDERYDSRIRDAELLTVAEEIAEHADDIWIVAGDLNDVAWSRTTRMFREVSGLADPRIGRGLLNTYHADHPLARYPLDHVFVSTQFRVGAFDRVRTPGSDHFAVYIELDLEARDTSPTHEPPDADEREETREIIREGKHDASEQGE